MIHEDIIERLFELQDKEYRDFQSNLTPTLDKENMIGVRTPELRAFAKELIKREDVDEFLNSLPHKYFEENQLHAFMISEIKDYDECIERINEFLPYVDNWATCDQMSPKVFKKNKDLLLKEIKRWIHSKETYTVRFAVGMLMSHFLDDDFDVQYVEMVSAVLSDEYYVKMMLAWYFATALAKQYDAVVPYIEENRLDVWTHNKAIQKAIESRRVSDERKTYLRTLKIKNAGAGRMN